MLQVLKICKKWYSADLVVFTRVVQQLSTTFDSIHRNTAISLVHDNIEK